MSKFTLIPKFLAGPTGALFCLCYEPKNDRGKEYPAIIHVPALAEEMNKSRRMVALQARKFAEEGYPVYVFDLYGTGDSQGELSDVGWDEWREDLRFLSEYVQEREGKDVWLWGLRGGCLLASDCLHYPSIVGGIYWQPIRDGQQVISQLQRLQRLGANDQEALSRSFEEGGEMVEIAGYTYNPQLLKQLSKVSLLEGHSLTEMPLILINVSILQNESENNLLKRLLSGEASIVTSRVIGDPFWLTPEISLVPELLSQTTLLFNQAQVK